MQEAKGSFSTKTGKKLKRGILIAIEGIDGAGKTTQARMLKEKLEKEGFELILLKEPTDSVFGQKIKQIALNGRKNISPEEELQLFIEDRKLDIKENIKPALDSHKVVIMDRYYFSSVAYQGALGLDVSSILKANEEFAPKPNICIVIDVAPAVGISRIKNGRKEKNNHFEREQYLLEVGKIFIDLKRLRPEIQKINGSPPPETVFENVYNIVKEFLDKEVKNS